MEDSRRGRIRNIEKKITKVKILVCFILLFITFGCRIKRTPVIFDDHILDVRISCGKNLYMFKKMKIVSTTKDTLIQELDVELHPEFQKKIVRVIMKNNKFNILEFARGISFEEDMKRISLTLDQLSLASRNSFHYHITDSLIIEINYGNIVSVVCP